MRIRPVPSILLHLMLAAPLQPQAQGDRPAKPTAATADLFRYEPTGLSLLDPYERGKIPVVFIHELWSSPASWPPMSAALEADPAIAVRRQF